MRHRRSIALAVLALAGCSQKAEAPGHAPAETRPLARGSLDAATAPGQLVGFRALHGCEYLDLWIGPPGVEPGEHVGYWFSGPPPTGVQSISVPLGHDIVLVDDGRPPHRSLQRLTITPELELVVAKRDISGDCRLFVDEQ